jgi:hypothetical protein
LKSTTRERCRSPLLTQHRMRRPQDCVDKAQHRVVPLARHHHHPRGRHVRRCSPAGPAHGACFIALSRELTCSWSIWPGLRTTRRLATTPSASPRCAAAGRRSLAEQLHQHVPRDAQPRHRGTAGRHQAAVPRQQAHAGAAA